MNAITSDGDNARIRTRFTILLCDEAHGIATDVSGSLCMSRLDQHDCREDDQYQADVRLIWVQSEEQSGEPTLADWMTIADEHEAKQHAAQGGGGS